jgi:hypothetical protein
MKCIFVTTLAACLTAAATADVNHVVTFDNGWEGWTGSGGTIVQSGGNPGAHAHTQLSNFGIDYQTSSNQAFLGDYTQYSSVTLSIDVKVNQINFFGTLVSRDLVLDLRSFSLGQDGYPWSSAWIILGELPGTGSDWTTYSITFDPNALGNGWGGTGDENPSAEPQLPENLTFADIMANVEAVSFSTYTPGFVYSVNTFFDLQVDNIRIEASMIPAPGAALALFALAGLQRRRRTRD